MPHTHTTVVTLRWKLLAGIARSTNNPRVRFLVALKPGQETMQNPGPRQRTSRVCCLQAVCVPPCPDLVERPRMTSASMASDAGRLPATLRGSHSPAFGWVWDPRGHMCGDARYWGGPSQRDRFWCRFSAPVLGSSETASFVGWRRLGFFKMDC